MVQLFHNKKRRDVVILLFHFLFEVEKAWFAKKKTVPVVLFVFSNLLKRELTAFLFNLEFVQRSIMTTGILIDFSGSMKGLLMEDKMEN